MRLHAEPLARRLGRMELVRGIQLAEIIGNHWRAYQVWKANNDDPECLRDEVVVQVERMLDCRTPRLGCHVYRCPNCDIFRIVPHSCHSRFCNSCAVARARDWADRALNDMLEVPYRHLVLGVPRPLRLLFKDNRERLMPLVMRAGADSVLALTSGTPEPLGRDARKRMAAARNPFKPGFQIALHTFGSALNWHVHLHLIVTAGGLSLDHERWISAPERSLIYPPSLALEFKLRVCEAIENEHEAHPLNVRRLRRDRRERLDPDRLVPWVRSMKWYCHVGPALKDPSAALKYCGRYTRRPAIGETRLLNYNGRSVTFWYKDYAQGGKRTVKTLPVLVFLDRLFQHIPAKHARPFLSYGLFATRVKGDLLPLARRLLGQREPPPLGEQSWETRRKAGGEDKPLGCPRCGAEMEFWNHIFGEHERIAELVGTPSSERIPYPTYVDRERIVKFG